MSLNEYWGPRSSSFKNSTGLFQMLLVRDVGLPVRSHEVHCLLSLEAVEHVLTHEGVLSVSVHLVAESQFLLLVDLSLHVVILDLIQQSVASIIHVNVAVHGLVRSSRCILNREWVEVSSAGRVHIWMELISSTSPAATIFHLNEVQGAANWGMHILEFPLSILLFTLGNLFLPNLSIIHLGVPLGLGSHLQVLSVMFNLGVELSFFNVSLILQLVDLLEEALLSCTEG